MGVDIQDTTAFINSLRALPRETDWVEFKTSNFDSDNIGKYISSLANSAILDERDEAYLVFGINPGEPLVEPDRFIDTPSKSRNPNFAKLMRAAGIVEQRGSGVDRAFREIEKAALPPPLIQTIEGATVVTLFTAKPFSQLTQADRVRACYQHACLQFEQNSPMGNLSLRRRFGLSDKQYPQVSNVIADAIEAGRIKPLNEGQANKIARYVPYWA